MLEGVEQPKESGEDAPYCYGPMRLSFYNGPVDLKPPLSETSTRTFDRSLLSPGELQNIAILLNSLNVCFPLEALQILHPPRMSTSRPNRRPKPDALQDPLNGSFRLRHQKSRTCVR